MFNVSCYKIENIQQAWLRYSTHKINRNCGDPNCCAKKKRDADDHFENGSFEIPDIALYNDKVMKLKAFT